MNEVFGLPAHPLLVHVPVVLIPLALVGVIVMLAKPQWRQALVVPTALIGIAGGFGAILASQSGEWLQARVNESQLVEQHQELGEMTRNLAILFAIALFVWALRVLVIERGWLADGPIARLLTPRWIGTAAAVGSLVLGALTTVWVVRTGHTGAKAAWEGKFSKSPRPGAEEH